MNMKKSAFMLLTAILLSNAFNESVYAQSEIKFRDLTFDQAMLEAGKTNKIIFVDVQNNRISDANKEVESTVFATDSVVRFFNEHVIPIRINMSTDEGKKFIPRLAMLMYPVYVFHDKTGDQLSFLNAGQILKDPGLLMQKARESLATAYTKSINDRHILFNDHSWKEILAKAKKENKLIFVDAYTQWCRPCIQMAKDVFTLNNVADFYNENFINVSMDMEKGEGPALGKKYQVKAYPAFLFIDGNGKVVHEDGGFQEAESFIKVGEAALKAKSKKK